MTDRWVIVALLVAVLFGLYHVFTKLASGRIPDAVGGFWLEGVALIGMGIYLLAIRQPLWGQGITRQGLTFAILGGVSVGLGTVLNFTMYRLHGPLSGAGPIVLMGALAIMAVTGVAFMGEELTPSRVVGWILAVAAIWFLSR